MLISSRIMPHICVTESGQHWFRQWFVAFSVPSHYLNQCSVIVNWTQRNTLQWNFNLNTAGFSFAKMHLNISSAKKRPACLGGEELKWSIPFFWFITYHITNMSAWWRHQMETFSALLTLCAGNSLVISEFPSQRPVTKRPVTIWC